MRRVGLIRSLIIACLMVCAAGSGVLAKAWEANPPPVAKAVASVDETNWSQSLCVLVGTTVYFKDDGSYDEDTWNDPLDTTDVIDSWSWDFDDGEYGSGALTSHVFDTEGDYVVTLTVDDVPTKADDDATISSQENSVAVHVTVISAPSVTDDGFYTTTGTQLHASWTPTGQAEYRYAIGTQEGGNDVVDWTSTGTDAFVTSTGLSLEDYVTYYFSVRYKTEGGCWSSIGNSDGILYLEQIPTFIYDGNGNRTAVIDSRGTTSYEYDVLGRLTKVTEPDGKWIAYTYDLNNNRTSMTVHLDSSTEHVTEYSYYDNNLLHEVTDQLDGVTHYTYDGGLVDTITYPNGTKAIHTYYSRNWLRTISNQQSDNTVIAEFTYSYGGVNNDVPGKNGTRTQVIEEILTPSGSSPSLIKAQVDYTYDDLYRLTGEKRSNYDGGNAGVTYNYDYIYDAAGNKTGFRTKDQNGNQLTYTSYSYDAANKMTGPGSFSYDNKGNMTHDGISGADYTWDYLNRMTQWEKTNEKTNDFLYNADGMRVRKTVHEIPSGETVTDFLLDGDEIVEEITGENVTSYVGPGLISKIAGESQTIYHADDVGSTRAISDENQAIVEAGVYDAYGNVAATYGNAPSFGYAGQFRYYKDETGLHHLKARYYDPAVGRFISRDPIGYRGGYNLYAYTDSNPANDIDPSGLKHTKKQCLEWTQELLDDAKKNYKQCLCRVADEMRHCSDMCNYAGLLGPFAYSLCLEGCAFAGANGANHCTAAWDTARGQIDVFTSKCLKTAK